MENQTVGMESLCIRAVIAVHAGLHNQTRGSYSSANHSISLLIFSLGMAPELKT